jgi:hypothetical protein
LKERAGKHEQAKPNPHFSSIFERCFLKVARKILSEERINTDVGGKIIGGLQRILAGPKGTFRQEVVYLGRSVGDSNSYPPEDQDRMLAEAKRLLFELAGQGPDK